MNGKQWNQLFDAYSQRKREQREQREITREMEAWFDEQIQLIMQLTREVVSERATALREASGVNVEVQSPSHPPINISPDGPFMSFMSLSLPEREVHLYSHRVSQGAPLIHFVVAGPSEGPERQRKRLLGRPGARLERREGGGFLLVGVGEHEGRALSVDDLAFRAFELLLEG